MYSLVPFLFKIHQKSIPKIISKNEHSKTWNSMPTGYQNGAKIDARTHQKSMPKLVKKKVMDIINNNVFLIGKIIQIRFKNIVFLSFGSLRARTEKVSNKHQP